MDIALSAHQALQLNTIAFFLFVVFSVALYRLSLQFTLNKNFENSDELTFEKASSGLDFRLFARNIVLLLINALFLVFFLSGLSSLLILIGLLLSTYALGQWRIALNRRKRDLHRVFGLVSIAFWVLLFLAKDPQLFNAANPFGYFPLKLIGVSFLFFRCINYVEDAPILKPHSLLDFVNFSIFFPTLIAGPLERFDRYIADFKTPRPVDFDVSLKATQLIATGVIKKFVLADTLYPLTGFGGSDPMVMNIPALWIVFLLHLVVLYLDFSGYTDMMLGIGRLLGFKLPENFNKPFLATNIQEFWERWHISLTSFIQDYLFTPLTRAIMFRTSGAWQFPLIVGNYFFTMMVIALWHGTTWGFVIFGVLHGIALVYLQIRKRYKKRWAGVAGLRPLTWDAPTNVARVGTYLYVSLTMLVWVYGPATSLAVLGRMIGLG